MKLFLIGQYDYAGLFSENYRKELSWKEKIFCAERYTTEPMMKILHNVENQEERETLQAAKGISTEKFSVSGETFVIKYSEYRGFIKNLLRMGLGVNIWNNAHWAKEKGIPVLKPVALIEKREWNKTKSFVIYLYEGKSCRRELAWYKEWLPKIQEAEQLLYRKGVVHHDFHIGNVLILEDGSLQFIDIDRLSWMPRGLFSYVLCERRKCAVSRFNKILVYKLEQTGVIDEKLKEEFRCIGNNFYPGISLE